MDAQAMDIRRKEGEAIDAYFTQMNIWHGLSAVKQASAFYRYRNDMDLTCMGLTRKFIAVRIAIKEFWTWTVDDALT